MAVLSEAAVDAGGRMAAARRAMIDSQLRVSGVSDPAVLAAMAALPREQFVPQACRATAYIDRKLPLGEGRWLNPPLSHGQLLIEAKPRPDDAALLIGGGTGYLAALLAPLVGSLQVVESSDALAAAAPARPGTWHNGPLAQGAQSGAPYTLIVIDGAIEQFPDALVEQLADHGRVVTGLVERGVVRLAAGRKAAGAVGFLTLAEADLAPLAEFAAPRRWSF